MELYFSVVALALVITVLAMLLRGRSAETAMALSICGCCIAVIALVRFLDPVIGFIQELESMISVSSGTVKILLKIVGIGLLGEIASLVCSDSGNGALGKSVQMLTACVIVYLSLPMLTALLELVKGLLEAG